MKFSGCKKIKKLKIKNKKKAVLPNWRKHKEHTKWGNTEENTQNSERI